MDSSDSEREFIELKSRFISMTSHQLRTPLAVIASSAGILSQFNAQLDEQKRQKHLQCIQTYVKHTTQLLDDILFLNKVETGHLAFEPAPLSLIEVCQELVDEVQLSTSEHTIRSSFPTQDTIDLVCRSQPCLDKKLLRQILVNLLLNAIRYSPQCNLIHFNLALWKDKIVFTIADRGIGISLSDQAQLFQPFHRGENVGAIAGTGLGLSIVKKCVELHQGRISVKSVLDVGTLFTVMIPLTLPIQ